MVLSRVAFWKVASSDNHPGEAVVLELLVRLRIHLFSVEIHVLECPALAADEFIEVGFVLHEVIGELGYRIILDRRIWIVGRIDRTKCFADLHIVVCNVEE